MSTKEYEERTSSVVAKIASKVLRDLDASEREKRLAGSALAQSRGGRKKKKREQGS